MGLLISIRNFWTRTGRRRDFAAGWIKMPIDYFMGFAGILYLDPIIAVTAYTSTFSAYVLLGWFLMEKTRTMDYDNEWMLQFNPPLNRIHDVVSNHRSKEDKVERS